MSQRMWPIGAHRFDTLRRDQVCLGGGGDMSDTPRWLPVRARICSFCINLGPGLVHRRTRVVVCFECLARALEEAERAHAKARTARTRKRRSLSKHPL